MHEQKDESRVPPWRQTMREAGIVGIEEVRLPGRITYLIVTWRKDGGAEIQMAKDQAGSYRMLGNPRHYRAVDRAFIERLATRILPY